MNNLGLIMSNGVRGEGMLNININTSVNNHATVFFNI